MAVSIHEARAAVLEHAHVLDAEDVFLDDALGRALAVDASAPNDVPPFAASAMDGFAIRAADTLDGSARPRAHRRGEGRHRGRRQRAPRDRRADLDRRAGARRRRRDRAAGDDDERRRDASSIDGQIRIGYHVRPPGEDIRAGELVVPAGSLLGPAELGVLASMNIPRPSVVRRPRVAIAGTGDELTDPGKPLKPGAIRDSNGPALGGAVHRAGGELVARVRVGDDLEATVSVLGAALRDVDMLITTGGVSVGPHDHVRPGARAPRLPRGLRRREAQARPPDDVRRRRGRHARLRAAGQPGLRAHGAFGCSSCPRWTRCSGAAASTTR